MKKILSVLCELAVLLGVVAMGTLGASAKVDAAQTAVDVKAGDEVTYTLILGDVPTKIIGCDFSIYYDADLLELESFADFSNSTDPENWKATLNTGLKGEVKGNWSILNGVKFTTARNFATLNLKAKAAGSAHISYYIRFMYDDTVFDSPDRPQITQYTFTCNVTVNGNTILEDAQPELNVDEPQKVGSFVNSVSGKGEDADVNTVVKNDDPTQSASDPSTVSDPATVTPDDGSKADPTASDDSPNGGSQTWLWIVIAAVVVVAGCGIGLYAVKFKKK